MAEQDAIICIGSSNMAGYLANLYDVPTADHVRWTSLATPTSSTPTRPYTFQVPGVRMWTPRRPYSTNSQRAITAISGGNTIITYGPPATPIGSPTVTAHMWCFVREGTGKGNLRKITAVAGQDLTVASALSPVPVATDTLVVLQDSHTIASISADSLTVTKTASSPAFTSAVVDRFASFFDSASGGETTRKITDWSATTITFDRALTTLPAVGTGFCVLSGANSAEDIDSLDNAVLQNLTFTLDDVSPVYLTGLDYTNWDFTPFASPRALSYDPTVNSVCELAFHVKSKTARPLVVLQMGVSASMISTFPIAAATVQTLVGPLHDITSLDFSPASPDGIYPILTAAITSLRSLVEAEGNTLKVRGIFINLFDNDGVDLQRINRLGSNARLLRDSLRTFLEDEDVPWLMSGPSAYGGGPGSATQNHIYAQLFDIAATDELAGVVDTRIGFTYAEDNFHLSALSQIKLGQEFFRVWEPIHERLVGPTAESDLVKIAICNRALVAVGDVPSITSLDPPEGSVHAEKCALLFPQVVDSVTTSRHWTFADRRVALEKVALVAPSASATTDLITTGAPHGLVEGSPLSFVLIGTALPAPLEEDTVYYAVDVKPLTFSVAETPDGDAINLTTAGTGEWGIEKESDRSGYAFMYALPSDCFVERGVVPAGAPDDWFGMDGTSAGRQEGAGFVASSTVGGLNFAAQAGGSGERKLIPFKRGRNAGGDLVIYCDLDDAELVYTRNLDDATQWPPEFRQAFETMMTSYLFRSVKKDNRAADEYLQLAQYGISEAARIDAQRVVQSQPSRFAFDR